MKKVLLKSICMGIIFSCVFSAFAYMNVKAKGANISKGYTWSEDKDYKSKKYMENLIENRNKKLQEVLGIEDVSNYMNDMKSLYDLCVKNGKVEEVEKIMSDYEKNQIYCELLLLTGDEELARKFRDDEALNFKFERVI